MKKLSLTAFAAAGLMAVAAPAFAAAPQKHAASHHNKMHTTHSKAKSQKTGTKESVSTTDALNAMSLQKAQTPVLTPPAVVTVPQKDAKELEKATGNAVMPVAPVPPASSSSSVMPATMPAPAPVAQ